MGDYCSAVLKLAIAQDFSVRHTIQRHTTGKTKVFGSGLLMDRTGKTQRCFLDNGLYRGGHIHVMLRKGLLCGAWRQAEQITEAMIRENGGDKLVHGSGGIYQPRAE